MQTGITLKPFASLQATKDLFAYFPSLIVSMLEINFFKIKFIPYMHLRIADPSHLLEFHTGESRLPVHMC